jgi:hypothetical protein
VIATPSSTTGQDFGGTERTEFDTGCALVASPIEDPRTESCRQCHSAMSSGHASQHPVDLDYASRAYARSGGMGLRPLAEVVRRGVFLPDGELRCVTCHDARSPWKFHLALPPGATPTPAVDHRDPSTYEDGPARAALVRAVRQPTSGQRLAVSPKPLCLACHAAD